MTPDPCAKFMPGRLRTCAACGQYRTAHQQPGETDADYQARLDATADNQAKPECLCGAANGGGNHHDDCPLANQEVQK